MADAGRTGRRRAGGLSPSPRKGERPRMRKLRAPARLASAPCLHGRARRSAVSLCASFVRSACHELPSARRRSSAGLRPPCAPALAQASGSGSAGSALRSRDAPPAGRRMPAEGSQRPAVASATLAHTLSGSAPAARSAGILAPSEAMPVHGSLRGGVPLSGAQRPALWARPKFLTLRTGAEMTNSVISDLSALADPSGGG